MSPAADASSQDNAFQDRAEGVFASTVDNYVRYRPDFPRAFYEAVATAFDLDGRERLLDLGTGTGHIALALSGQFESVLGVDPNPDMLEAARQQTSERGVANVEWQLRRAEDVDLQAGSVRLVTVGNALHWMDRASVLARCHQLVRPGGGIAIVDMPGMWSPNMQLGTEPWLEALREVIERHLGTRRRAGDGYYEPQHEPAEDSLRQSPFEAIESGGADLDLTWSIDEVVGYLYSTSFANRSQLGDGIETFERDLLAALGAAEPAGRFRRRLRATWAFGYRR